MTTPEVPGVIAVTGQLAPGTVIADASSHAAHKFFQIIKDIVRNSGTYSAEHDVTNALAAIDGWRQHVIVPAHRHSVKTEEDPAGIEDVTRRVAPRQGHAPVPAVNMTIDYTALAAAIIAAQQAAAAPEAPPASVQDISSLPAAPVQDISSLPAA